MEMVQSKLTDSITAGDTALPFPRVWKGETQIDSPEKIRIYHHGLHAKKIKKSSILQPKTDSGIVEGLAACIEYL